MTALRFGVHLPQIDFGDQAFHVDRLVEYTETAVALGFDAIAANDHLLFSAPWLDGPTALTAVVACSADAALFTTVSNPVLRGPMALAKTLTSIDVLSGGRLVAAIAPGSSAADYRSAGIPFEQRWPRFDEAVAATRAILGGRDFTGRYYTVDAEPRAEPVRGDGPPIWIGSWGSPAGLRRVARYADGWLASAFHSSTATIAAGRDRLDDLLLAEGRDPADVPLAVATLWFHIADADDAARILRERVAPALAQPADALAERVAFGPPQRVAQRLAGLHAAGAGRVFVWPVADEIDQLRRFATDVVPLLTG
ncbi:LLM class flavin-dependent oxidoreductase [Aldersonia sp. NBC_00410]|uniref:LLM class flavin-dependent oxidoreductase n=1 Tax=Aldersonia sp. NBC_00410 TaxID=2975954 RepID=UPI00224F6D51|nr:LLM class flavin-dependent oxidoreductase [Aldersonia sp. NBC_00410]MCX5045846.1 LLM class flavin-dependent oxidoreductase [Aldersonia sp. NBC_00410]